MTKKINSQCQEVREATYSTNCYCPTCPNFGKPFNLNCDLEEHGILRLDHTGRKVADATVRAFLQRKGRLQNRRER